MKDFYRISEEFKNYDCFKDDKKKGFSESLMVLDLMTRGVLRKTGIDIRGVNVILEEGQFAVTRSLLAEDWGVSENTVKGKLIKFINKGYIRKVRTLSNNINVYKCSAWVDSNSYHDVKCKDEISYSVDPVKIKFLKEFLAYFNDATGKKIVRAKEVELLYSIGYRDIAVFKGVLDFKIKEYKSMNNHKYIRVGSIFNVNRFEGNIEISEAGGFIDKHRMNN